LNLIKKVVVQVIAVRALCQSFQDIGCEREQRTSLDVQKRALDVIIKVSFENAQSSSLLGVFKNLSRKTIIIVS
jgi:hypothetical protein